MALLARAVPCAERDRAVKEKFRPDSLRRSKNAHSSFCLRPRTPEPMPLSVSRLASLALAAVLVVPMGHATAQSLGALLDPGQGRGGGSDHVDRGQRGEDRSQGMDERHDRGEDHRALSDAVRRVERRTGGQVLSAERVPFDGRNVNRVKVIDSSGRVRVYMDDPQPQGQDRRQPEPRDDD